MKILIRDIYMSVFIWLRVLINDGNDPLVDFG